MVNMDEPEITDYFLFFKEIVLWLFIFCAAGAFWQWQGMAWWAGVFGMIYVIIAFVALILAKNTEDYRSNDRRRDRRSW